MVSLIEINIPTLHEGQVAAYRTPGRFKALRCGRRWGKTDFAKTVAGDALIKGRSVFWAAPDYKIQSEAFNEIADMLLPIRKQSSKIEGVFRTVTGGRIDFWSLENERAGRSRKYHLAIIDEAAFTKPNMMQIWNTAIKPALLDYKGSALVLSTPNGSDPDNFFWRICNEPEHGFTEFHAPTAQNPYLPVDELAKLESENAPLVYAQEYAALFVDWSGSSFFNIANCLEDGQPIDWPDRCDAVFATIDTSAKDNRHNDGSAVCYWALNRYSGTPLTLLDWDIIQIPGDLLENWLPTIFENLGRMAPQCKARHGSIGAFLEDKSTGIVLNQQGARRGWPVHAIDSKLTALGKSERAINVSGYVHQGMVKISRQAYERLTVYKGQTKNHLVSQVFSFRIGVDNLDDDLADCWMYGIAIGLGDSTGF